MNDYIRELVQTWLEDNGRISDLATEIYDHAFEEGRRSKTWLPPVTEQQVAAWVASEPHDSRRLVRTLTEFFNDPNRDAPAKATMHPDLEWLAKQDPFSLVTNCTGPEPILYYKDDGGNVAVWRNTSHPYGKALFSRSKIEQARKHLAKEKVNEMSGPWKQEFELKQPAMSREGALEALRGFFCYEPQAYRNAIVSDMAADAKVLARALNVLAEEDQMLKAPPHVGVRKDVGGRVAEDGTPLDLNNLPDYETWFEAHGWETVNRDTRMAVVDSDVPATVHELYTHFRARLLDELRQAGVIGDDQ